jgi:hypothetical protein
MRKSQQRRASRRCSARLDAAQGFEQGDGGKIVDRHVFDQIVGIFHIFRRLCQQQFEGQAGEGLFDFRQWIIDAAP